MSVEFDTNDGNIIQTIQDAVKTETIKVASDDFVTRPVFLPPKKDLAKRLEVASLTGLVDYINEGIDGESRAGSFVVVDSPSAVSFYNDIADREDRRFNPIDAAADTPTLIFDQYIGKEQAIIMLQSRFVETGERAELLEQLGNIVAEEELQQEDDGVSQTITTQQGIRRGAATIQNPVQLRPFRTFTEIDQPESPFIVRLRKTSSGGIEVGFFEADGGAWRNKARRDIKAFLQDAITSEVPVIA